MSLFKFLFIFILVVLYTSPEHSWLMNPEHYLRVVAAPLNL